MFPFATDGAGEALVLVFVALVWFCVDNEELDM